MFDIKREGKIAYSEMRFNYSKLENEKNAEKSKLGRDFLKKLVFAIRSHFCIR